MKTIATASAALGAILMSTAIQAADMAEADMLDTEGATIGKVTFEQAPSGVLMLVDVTGLPPGWHAIHLHSVGACTPDFKAAKGHINPYNAKHGLRHPEGPDNGDLPNLHAAADGSVKAEFFTARVSVAEGDMPVLLDEDGSAVIIHDQPDDHITQPIGGAGGRIGCGVIRKMQPEPAGV